MGLLPCFLASYAPSCSGFVISQEGSCVSLNLGDLVEWTAKAHSGNDGRLAHAAPEWVPKAPYSARRAAQTACKCSVQISSIHPGSDLMTMDLQADSKTASALARTISSAAASVFSHFSFG